MAEGQSQPDHVLERKKRRRGVFVAIALIAAILLVPKIDFFDPPIFTPPTYADASTDAPNLPVEVYPSSRYRAAAEKLVRRQLRDPGSAVFSDIQVYPPRGNRSAVVCGMVAARNGYGGMNAAQRFIAAHQTILEAQVGPALMDQAWVESCR